MTRSLRLSQLLAGALVVLTPSCLAASRKGALEGLVTDSRGNPVRGAIIAIGRPVPGGVFALIGPDRCLCCEGQVMNWRPSTWGANIPPVWVDDIPAGGKDFCENSKYLHKTKTDGQGRYRVEAPEMDYEVLAARPPDSPRTAKLAETPVAYDSVQITAGETVTRNLILRLPADLPAGPLRDSLLGRGQKVASTSDWPTIYEGPIDAGGTIRFDVGAPPRSAGIEVHVTFEPAMKDSSVSFVIDGRKAPTGAGAESATSRTIHLNGRPFAFGRHSLEIAFREKAAMAKIQAVVAAPDGAAVPAPLSVRPPRQ